VLELERSEKKIKLDGQTYPIKPITRARAMKHEALVKECDSDTEKILMVFTDLLVELGVPNEAVESLEIEHFKIIADYLFQSKKK
jgi:hypothetical protein